MTKEQGEFILILQILVIILLLVQPPVNFVVCIIAGLYLIFNYT